MSVSKYQTKTKTLWMVRYRDPNGKQHKQRGFTTKKIAELWEAENVTSPIIRNNYYDPNAGKITIGQLWETVKEYKKVTLGEKFYKDYLSAWTHHVKPYWEHTSLGDVTVADVERWINQLATKKAHRKSTPLSATIILRSRDVLSAIFKQAVKDKLIPSNPVVKLENLPKKQQQPHVYLSHEQVEALASASKYPVLIYTLAYTGLRWGEATALRVDDFNPIKRRLAVNKKAYYVNKTTIHHGRPKTHTIRTVPTPNFLVELLQEHIKSKNPGDLIFSGPKGGVMARPKNDHSWFMVGAVRAGIPRITPHDLRHTSASLAVQAGANIKAIQRMLGHASAVMTLNQYAGLFDSDLDILADKMEHFRIAKLAV